AVPLSVFLRERSVIRLRATRNSHAVTRAMGFSIRNAPPHRLGLATRRWMKLRRGPCSRLIASEIRQSCCAISHYLLSASFICTCRRISEMNILKRAFCILGSAFPSIPFCEATWFWRGGHYEGLLRGQRTIFVGRRQNLHSLT